MRINVTHLSESTRQCIKPKVYWIFWFNSYTYQVRLIIETYHINNQDLEFPCVRGVGGGVLSAAEFMPHIPLALLFITSVQAKQQPHLFCFIIDGSTTPKNNNNWMYVFPVWQSWHFAVSTLHRINASLN